MMKLRKTAKIKPEISPGEVLATITAYTKAFNYACQVGYGKGIFNRFALHKVVYQDIREKFDLPSQLTISVIAKSTENLKTTRKKKLKYGNKASCPKSDQQSIRLDANSYSLFLKSSEVSILTVSGRKRCPLNISDYHQQYFSGPGWKHTSAELILRKNKIFLHVCFEKDLTDPQSTGNFIGVDRGIKNIATTSKNQFFGGRELSKRIIKFLRLKRNLQQKGTKSAKRHLRRLSGKERRFRADINHQISKKIVSSLKSGDTIVLEDLKGITTRKKKMRKKMRSLLHGWAFFQLQEFLTYKAAEKGILVIFVPAPYTSQKCSECGHTEAKNRKGMSFYCLECGFKLNADLNAARNISLSGSYRIRNQLVGATCPDTGAVVNQPIVSSSVVMAPGQMQTTALRGNN